ncbi:MAG: extracellular solute-binding protein [Anaerolineae bacterium]|nr:extracellular solute-binding protein [Anaerolineae bacterium]
MKGRFSLLMVVLALMLALTAVVPAFAQDPIEIPVWIAFTDDSRLGWAQDKAAEFNAAFPQYNVTITGYPNYEEIFTSTALAAEQGSLPAIVQWNEVSTQIARDSGYYKAIEEALGGRTEVNGVPFNLDDIVASVAAYYTLDGQFSSMPWNASSSIMFSNMTYLDAAGLDTPPATWADMDAACAAIMALDNAPQYCWTWPNHGWFFEQWLAQQDGLYANNGNGRDDRATEVEFGGDAGLAIFNFLEDQYNKGYLYYSGARDGDSWATVDQAFGAQEVAMAIYSSSDTTYYTNMGVDNGFEVVASFMPYNQEVGWTGNLIGGASLWLVNGLPVEEEDGALTFLAWFTNTENAADWHKRTGYIPLRNSSVELLTSEGWFEENPNQTVAFDQLNTSTVTPATAGALVGPINAIRGQITAAIDTLLLSDTASADVMAGLVAEANAQIEEYNLLNQ